MLAFKTLLSVALAVALSLPLAAQDVGYYDMTLGQGNPTQVPSIIVGGGNPILISDLSPVELAGIDVLYVQNPDNGAFGGEYLTNLANVEAAVSAGMVLMIHDRFVTTAETILPGGAGFIAVRNVFNDIDFQDTSTLVSNGPGGVLNDTDLDGGGSSSHGYVDAASLPAGAVKILNQAGSLNQIVTMSYSHGSGAVIYSTIPLDHFLAFGTFPPAEFIYAPNVVAYAISLQENVVLSVTGSCPGPSVLAVAGASALSPVAFVYGAAGSFVIPGGSCAGLALAISSPQVAFVALSDIAGSISVSVTLPPAACGRTLQAVDLTGCSASNAVVL